MRNLERQRTASTRTVPEGIYRSEAEKNSFGGKGTGRVDAELRKTKNSIHPDSARRNL